MKLSQVLVVLSMTAMMLSCSSPGDGKEGKASAKIGPTRAEAVAGIRFEVPESWKSVPPTSSMRAAQFQLPARQGEEAPELVVFFFGPGQGGETQPNIDRWIGQMKEPGGKSAEEEARQESRTVGDLKVTTVRVNGTYSAGSMMPGMSAGEDKPGYRMWGAVVEGKGGPWFFKATGPQKSMQEADPAFDNIVSSLEPAPAAPDTTQTE
jgi:hypothetical protein